MDETLRQLGGLLLGSIPTIIMLLVLWGAYAAIVHTPLSKVLAERRAKTQGAIEKARDGQTQNVKFKGSMLRVLPASQDRKSTRLNSSHLKLSRMPSSA